MINYDELCSYDVVTQLPSNIKKISVSQNNSVDDIYSVDIKNKSVSYSSDINQDNIPIKVLKKISLVDSKGIEPQNDNNSESTKSKSIESNIKNEHTSGPNAELTKPSRNKDLYKSPNKHYTINTKIHTPVIENDSSDDDNSTSDTFSCSTYNTILSNLENKYKTTGNKKKKEFRDTHIDTSPRKVYTDIPQKDMYVDTKKRLPISPSSSSSSDDSADPMTPETVDFLDSKYNGQNNGQNNRLNFQNNIKEKGKNMSDNSVNSKNIFIIPYSSIVTNGGKFCTYGSGTYSMDQNFNIEHMVPYDSVITEFAIKLDSRLPIKKSIKFGIMVNGIKLKSDILYISEGDVRCVKRKMSINHIINKYDTLSLYSESNLAEYSVSGFMILRSNV